MARLNAVYFLETDYFNGNSSPTTSPHTNTRVQPIEINKRQGNSKTENERVAVQEPVEKQPNHTKFKRCLTPLLFLMKLAGLYFDDSGKVNLLNRLS